MKSVSINFRTFVGAKGVAAEIDGTACPSAKVVKVLLEEWRILSRLGGSGAPSGVGLAVLWFWATIKHASLAHISTIVNRIVVTRTIDSVPFWDGCGKLWPSTSLLNVAPGQIEFCYHPRVSLSWNEIRRRAAASFEEFAGKVCGKHGYIGCCTGNDADIPLHSRRK